MPLKYEESFLCCTGFVVVALCVYIHRTTTALDNHLNRTAVKPKFRQLKNVTQISFSYANNNNVLLPTDNSVSHVGPSMWFPLILIAYQSLLMYINHYLTYYT